MEITIQIDPDVEEWIERMTQEYGYNPQYWLMEAARVARYEIEDSQAADRAFAKMKILGQTPIPSAEIEKKYGIQD